MYKNRQKGITLIALVITIIVLLILAGVTIAMLSGNASSPQKATEAAQKDAIASAKDEIAMEVQEALLNYYNNTYVATSATGASTTASTQSIVQEAAGRAVNNVKTRNKELEGSNVSGNTITLKTKSYQEIGTIGNNGAITWGGITAVAGNNGGGSQTPVTPDPIPVEPTGVTVTNNTNETTRKVGETLSLSATIAPEGAEGTIEWVSDPEGAVTFNPTTGTSTIAKAATAGKATIKAKVQGKTIESTGLEVTIEEDVQTQDISTLTSTNYGQNIILSPTGITGVGQETNEDDWKILYKDSTGKVYAILSDYLPKGNSAVSAAGLTAYTNSSYLYSVKSTSQTNLVNSLKHATAWKSLVSSTLRTKYSGIEVYGALEENTMRTIKGSGNYYQAASSQSYGTHKCYGYWLASPNGSYYVWTVGFGGGANGNDYGSANFGVCPVVILPSNVQITEKSAGVWEVK